MTKILPLLLFVAACASPRPDTYYWPRPHGAIDLSANPNARHCSELTGDFRDAYSLDETVQTVRLISVTDDLSQVILHADGAQIPSSNVISDDARVRAFWYREDRTLAIILDHGNCRGYACAAEVSIIKYNGARTPAERPSKLCYERWIGTFERDPNAFPTKKTTHREGGRDD